MSSLLNCFVPWIAFVWIVMRRNILEHSYLTISSTFLLAHIDWHYSRSLGYCLLLKDNSYHFPLGLQYSLVSTQVYVVWVGVGAWFSAQHLV